MYVESINGWGEFSDGELSGWMYRVNGVFPAYSSSLRVLRAGDRVEWLFTRNLGEDLGGGFSDDGLSSVNKTALEAAIAEAEDRTQANYTSASWLAMEAALTAAGEVLNNENATQAEIDAAVRNLREAIAGLTELSGLPRSIALSESSITFPAAALGYSEQPYRTVSITNNGMQALSGLTVRAGTTNFVVIGNSTENSADLNPGYAVTFTIRPRVGLEAGTHTDVITVGASGAAAQIIVLNFTVNAADDAPESDDLEEAVYTTVTTDPETAVAEVEAQVISNLVERAIEAASENIIINVPVSEGINRVELELTIESVMDIEADGLSLTLQSDIATITLDAATLRGLIYGESGDTVVRIASEQLTVTSLNESQRNVAGDNFVINLTVMVGERVIRNFDGSVTVVIPYSPRIPAEEHDLLTVYHIDTFGNIQEMAGAGYSGSQITFITNHFSLFFVSEWISPFTDVLRNAWFYRSVRYAYSNDLMTGTAEGVFSPDVNLTRAMIVTILWRLEGRPTALNGGTFSDVRDDRWYSAAVAWAGETGIASGVGNGRFAPGDTATREQLATILYNYAGFKGVDTTAGSFANEFSDEGSVSSWALDAMQWANANGIIRGRTLTTLVPGGTATRAETATMFMQFAEKL